MLAPGPALITPAALLSSEPAPLIAELVFKMIVPLLSSFTPDPSSTREIPATDVATVIVCELRLAPVLVRLKFPAPIFQLPALVNPPLPPIWPDPEIVPLLTNGPDPFST